MNDPCNSGDILLCKIRETIKVADNAAASLDRAGQAMGEARNWGMWDMFGGGMVSGMMKHSRLDKAKSEIEGAGFYLEELQSRLQDIEIPPDVHMDISGFMSEAYLFFDNFAVNWMVQSKIKDSQKQVINTKIKVQEILSDLKNWENKILTEAC